jgi:hypothetical protein
LLELSRIQLSTRLLLMSSSPKPLAEFSFEESELLKNIQQLPGHRTRWTKHSVLDIVTY